MDIDAVGLIQNVGVPLGFALLFYLDFRKIIQKNTESITKLQTMISQICIKLEEKK